MILSRTPALPLAAIAALVLAACGDDAAGETSPDDGTPAIVATTSIWADITSEVACGADIPAVIPAGADPHSYEPSLRDREVLEDAEIVIANGLDLEEPLLDVLNAVSSTEAASVLEVSIYVDVLVGDDHDEDHDSEDHDSEDHGDEDHDSEDHDSEDHDSEDHGEVPADDGHGHGADGDPHFWQDPLRVAGALDAIATAVAAQGLPTCTDAYRDELIALDAEITDTLAVVPDGSRVMVTSHESLAYFADRYGFEIIGTVIPGTSTLAQTNAADLGALADEIELLGVPAVFTEELESTADADALAERLGIAVVPLVTDALTDDPETDTYVEMMRTNAAKIAAALAP